jgi:hypothetical protein
MRRRRGRDGQGLGLGKGHRHGGIRAGFSRRVQVLGGVLLELGEAVQMVVTIDTGVGRDTTG